MKSEGKILDTIIIIISNLLFNQRSIFKRWKMFQRCLCCKKIVKKFIYDICLFYELFEVVFWEKTQIL